MTLPKPAIAILLLAGVGTGAERVRPGELLLAEDFRSHEVYSRERLPLAGGWQVRVAHGVWRRSEEGVLSTWESGHSPVLVVEGEFGDVVVELEFRYRVGLPGQWSACRVSATNTVLHPRAYAASVWANQDFRSRAAGLVLEHDTWGGHITQVSRKMMTFEPDTWHTLRLAIVGDRAEATCGQNTVSGQFPAFGLPKNSLWIATGQGPHEIRRLRVYAARPVPASVRPDAP